MKSRATIADVAAHAKVSKVTVSYVLNGRSEIARISESTADRVRASAEELNYRPNPVARTLKTRKAGAIAVVFQYADFFAASSAFTNEVMRGVCEGAKQADVDIVLHTRSAKTPQDEVAQLTDGRVDGILILRDGDDPVLRALTSQTEIPVVSFFAATGPAWVDSDNEGGARLAVDHLQALGHRRLLFVSGAPGSLASRERVAGFVSRCEERPRVISATDEVLIRDAMLGPDRPTGVLCWSDDAAVHLMRRLAEWGLRCPEDVSIIGFDSLEPARTSRPALTSVAQSVATVARTGTHLLVDLIAGPCEATTLRHPMRLDVRESTRALDLPRSEPTARPSSNAGLIP